MTKTDIGLTEFVLKANDRIDALFYLDGVQLYQRFHSKECFEDFMQRYMASRWWVFGMTN